MGADLPAHVRDLIENPVELHSALESFGMSPNLRVTRASPTSPVAGSLEWPKTTEARLQHWF